MSSSAQAATQVSPPLSGSGMAFPTFTAWIGWPLAWTAGSVGRFEFSPSTVLATATSCDGKPRGSRPASSPQEKAVIPLLRKKNLRSIFDSGIGPESPYSIFDRPITYTRASSNAIIALGFVVRHLIEPGSRLLSGVVTGERKRTCEEARALKSPRAEGRT